MVRDEMFLRRKLDKIVFIVSAAERPRQYMMNLYGSRPGLYRRTLDALKHKRVINFLVVHDCTPLFNNIFIYSMDYRIIKTKPVEAVVKRWSTFTSTGFKIFTAA